MRVIKAEFPGLSFRSGSDPFNTYQFLSLRVTENTLYIKSRIALKNHPVKLTC